MRSPVFSLPACSDYIRKIIDRVSKKRPAPGFTEQGKDKPFYRNNVY